MRATTNRCPRRVVGRAVLVPHEILCVQPVELPADVELDHLLDHLVLLSGPRDLLPDRLLRRADEEGGRRLDVSLQLLRAGLGVVELHDNAVVEVLLSLGLGHRTSLG